MKTAVPDAMSDHASPLLRALASTARRDALVKAAAGVFVLASTLPWLAETAGAPVPPRPWFAALNLSLLLLILASLTWRLGDIAWSWERSFWQRLAVAYGFWTVGLTLPEVFPGPLGPLPVSTVEIVFSAVFYLLLMRAVEGQPHLPSPDIRTGTERLFTWPSVTFFVLGLMIYFVFIPLIRADSQAANRMAEVYFYALIDFYLILRLLFLSRIAKSRRWRAIYVAFALPWFFILAADVNFLVARALPAWPLQRIPGWWWNLPFVLLVLAVRLRHHPFAKEGSEPSVADVPGPPHAQLSFTVSARTLAFGLVFPVLHIVLYRFELLDAPSRGARQGLVLVWLIVFGVIALVQHRYFERRAQALWLDRVRFEEELMTSEKDLRLIVERNRAQERIQAAEERFDLAFRACPYTLAISSLPGGRLLEVNPAFEQTFGYRREEVIGRRARSLGLWSDPERLRRVEQLIAAGQEVRELEVVLRRKSGDDCLALFSAVEIELEGKPSLLSIVHDVTARRRAEKRLAAVAGLLDDAEAAIFESDVEGRVACWSRGAVRLSGRPESEVVGQPVRDLLAPPAAVDSMLDGAGDGEWSGTLELVTCNGQRLPVNAWCTRVGDGRDPRRARLVIATPRA